MSRSAARDLQSSATTGDTDPGREAQAERREPALLEILFEDEHLLAVSKPAGVVAHPCYKHPDGTVFNMLLWHLRAAGVPAAHPAASIQGSASAQATAGCRCLERRRPLDGSRRSAFTRRPDRADDSVHPRLLHRLDKGTSGVMLVSKTMTAHAAVVRAMARGAGSGFRKEYLAVVHGVPDPKSGEISLRLRRDPADSRRVAASETEGKESVTRYEVLERRVGTEGRGPCDASASRKSPPAGLTASIVLCELRTGRMHQIRVHLAARGWPIVGDPVYGPGEIEGAPIGRQALHAWRVSLAHPVTRAPLVITAPIPADMRALLDRLGLTAAPPG